jgi:HPt (histidine-containing phosphotransfer) domain-containing protein
MSMILFWSHREALRSEVTRLLSARGHQVCPTGSAGEAWAIWASTPPPKLAIIDGDGQGDGAGAIDWIEQLHAEGEPATVVYLSGEAVPPRLGRLLGRTQILFVSPELAPLTSLVDSLLAQQARQSDEGQGEIENELAQLRDHYRRNLGDRLAEIERALDESRRRPAEQDRFEMARTLVHRLHGTAGSFGFPRVSAAARRLEELLERVNVDEPGSWDGVGRDIEQALSGLREAAANPDSRG